MNFYEVFIPVPHLFQLPYFQIFSFNNIFFCTFLRAERLCSILIKNISYILIIFEVPGSDTLEYVLFWMHKVTSGYQEFIKFVKVLVVITCNIGLE